MLIVNFSILRTTDLLSDIVGNSSRFARRKTRLDFHLLHFVSFFTML